MSDQIVIVAGDVTLDWNLAATTQQRDGEGVWQTYRTRACCQWGGAALLADIIDSLSESLHRDSGISIDLRRASVPSVSVGPSDSRFHHSYCMWRPEKGAWRLEEYLGLDAADSLPGREFPHPVAGDTGEAGLALLNDSGLGFRGTPEWWPAAIAEGNKPGWVLLKTSCPVADGELWENLSSRYADRMVVVVTADDLRLTEVHISRELSWERTAQDLYWELIHNPQVNALSRCAHVVVSFDTAGALLLSRIPADSTRAAAHRCTLFFDPSEIEGTWAQRHPGSVIGNTSTLTAGIARQILLKPGDPDVAQGIQAGLAGMRKLHLEGYGDPGSPASQADLTFPFRAVAGELARGDAPFAVAEIQDPIRFLSLPPAPDEKPAEPGFWTILQERYRGGLDPVARDTVLNGPDAALRDVPLGRFGRLVTVDRREIESYRSVRNVIAEYCGSAQNKPMSVAVFGPPGSGKSFGVEEIANSIRPGAVKAMTFNLSQFGGQENLLDALHQVRDVGLMGRIPLVFWDEFDTELDRQPLGWLRYFLAPMQDGVFQHGQITHPIGRAIFVFAGGTCKRMEDFDKGSGDAGFRGAKGPDFVSRLRGYIDIMGPNRQAELRSGSDQFYLLRRAILLRSTLQRLAPSLFSKADGNGRLNIDTGVLRALLMISEYRYGARSIGAIVAMSQLKGQRRFERSCLPAEDQLDLHVNGREFLALVQQLELGGDVLDRLAAASHEAFCDTRAASGWTYDPVRDDASRKHNLLIPYADLPDAAKESNRLTVRDIPRKLAAAGYVMVPSRSNETPLEFPGDDIEKLGRLEHDLWVAHRLSEGYTCGTPSTTSDKLNPNLVSWEQLPEEVRVIDYDLIKAIPVILARAGYAVVKT